ncbi:MAG: FixH family protein [Roseovarius indicus]
MMAVKEITGKHVLIGFVLAFGVIIGVNILLAVSAVKTFPGLEVKNSYIASQTFDERKAAQEALGWTIGAHHHDGILTLSITDEAGEPVRVAKLDATVGRATNVAQDVTPDFRFDGNAYVAPVELGGGNWNIRMEAIAGDGTNFRQRVVLIKD